MRVTAMLKPTATASVSIAVLLAAQACTITGPTYSLGEDEAWAIMALLAELAEGAEDNASVRPCPLGGETAIRATTVSEQRGDTTLTSARWVLIPSGCAASGASSQVTTSGNPDVTLASETALVAGRGVRIAATATGTIHWNRNLSEAGGSCPINLRFESTELNSDGKFVGTPTGHMCGRDAPIPLSAIEWDL